MLPHDIPTHQGESVKRHPQKSGSGDNDRRMILWIEPGSPIDPGISSQTKAECRRVFGERLKRALVPFSIPTGRTTGQFVDFTSGGRRRDVFKSSRSIEELLRVRKPIDCCQLGARSSPEVIAGCVVDENQLVKANAIPDDPRAETYCGADGKPSEEPDRMIPFRSAEIQKSGHEQRQENKADRTDESRRARTHSSYDHEMRDRTADRS